MMVKVYVNLVALMKYSNQKSYEAFLSPRDPVVRISNEKIILGDIKIMLKANTVIS